MNMKPIVYSAATGAVRILFEGTLAENGQATMEKATNYVLLNEGLATVPFGAAFDATAHIATLTPQPAVNGTLLVRVLKAITGDADTPFVEVATNPTPTSPGSTALSGPLDVQIGPHELVEDARIALRTQRDAFSYPILTEDITTANRQAGSGRSRGDGSNLTTLVNQTLADVLGWKARTDDASAFEGALTASFEIAEVDGVSSWKWTPRSYAVQSDLSGGITGAQASLYRRAQEALEQSMPLLDGLYPLDPKADVENIAALKAVVRTQFTQLVSELATPGGPGEARVNSYFGLLLIGGGQFQSGGGALLTSEPDELGGTLGELRDQLGLRTTQNFVNTIEDEQDLTNFRILADYATSLAQTWLNNRHFFGFGKGSRFLGTQLVPLSRQLTVISDAVDEVRFALDSVFIGAAERQTLPLSFGPPANGMYAEDFLQWIQNFAEDEAPIYVQQGGKFGIGNSLLPIAQRLHGMARDLKHQHGLPPGFYTSRVERTIDSLIKELGQLVTLAKPVGRDFTSPIPQATLLVTPLSLGVDVDEPVSSPPISLLNTGSADVDVEGRIVSGADKFAFSVKNATPSQVKLRIKARSSRDVIIQDIGKPSNGDVGTAQFTYRLADGTGGTADKTVQLTIIKNSG